MSDADLDAIRQARLQQLQQSQGGGGGGPSAGGNSEEDSQKYILHQISLSNFAR